MPRPRGRGWMKWVCVLMPEYGGTWDTHHGCGNGKYYYQVVKALRTHVFVAVQI